MEFFHHKRQIAIRKDFVYRVGTLDTVGAYHIQFYLTKDELVTNWSFIDPLVRDNVFENIFN